MHSTLTVSQARSCLYRLIDETTCSHQPIHITGKRNQAVLLSMQDWNAIQETLYLTSIPGMRESIQQGRAEPLEQALQELDW
jgi:antitoxin YefM